MIRLRTTLISVCVAFLACLALGAGGKVTDVCRQSPSTAICYVMFIAWYYDPKVMECREFVYGGCGGNGNRFKTELECYATCQDVCRQSPHTGICYALYVAWYYDPKVMECREFVYGGCGGNGNRFKTELECYATCQEKLKVLHPPKNVTVMYVQETQLFLYWYPPHNYKMHEVDNITYTYLNMGSDQKSEKGTGVTHIVINPITSTPVPVNATKVNITGNNATILAPSNGSNNTVEVNGTANTGVTSKPVEVNGTADTANPGEVNGTASPAVIGNETDTNYTGKDKVPFHLARLTNYIVSYRKSTTDPWINVTLPINTTELHIKQMTPATKYTLIVSARYAANTTISSEPINVITRLDNTQAVNCHCDVFGTVGGYRTCNLTLLELPWCKCKTGFTGLFCELCNNGFYRTALNLPPCHRCPCSSTSSSGSCHFVEGYLHCTRCLKGYTGNLCQRCSNGYYRNRDVKSSQCSKCVGCHNVRPGLICDPYSGKCINCHYNTTGHQCDRCLPGFVGDPLKNISCTAPSVSQKKYHPPNTGVIAAICVGIIIVLSAIVGVVVYCRMRNYPKQQPFWTVELNEGHDDVCFRSEDEANDADDDFGNSYRFKPTSKLAYQKLNS